MGRVELLVGDNLEHLRAMPAASVDAVVTDPPAGIAFMGREWDTDKGGRREWIAWLASVMSECLRVLKPGGHALVWALPRTSHWTGSALEDAGFEVRDCLVHHFGSGFPKSHAIGKAIDRLKGAERSVVGQWVPTGNARIVGGRGKVVAALTDAEKSSVEARSELPITAPATPEAAQWEGWGSALKPASEHWWLCRKPLAGTLAENVLEWGTGGINVDGCRVGAPNEIIKQSGDLVDLERGACHSGYDRSTVTMFRTGKPKERGGPAVPAGRWPPNLLLSHLPECGESDCADGCAVRELDRQSGSLKGGVYPARSASRFFPVFRYQAKASRREREAGLREAVVRTLNGNSSNPDEPVSARFTKIAANSHPTVKSVDLMRWLVRLVTPPGGVVLDPFAGSGTTGIAALYEGAAFIGIELLEEYAAIARGRLAYAEQEASRPVKTRAPRAAKAARASAAGAPVQLGLFNGGARA